MKYLLRMNIVRMFWVLVLPCVFLQSSQAISAESKHYFCSKDNQYCFNWESYKDAKHQSQLDGKPICLYFTGSDWCVWCEKMEEEILSSSAFVNFATKHLHMVKIDFPKSPNQKHLEPNRYELKKSYDVLGFPTMVFIDADGKELARSGFEYGGGEAFVKKLKAALGIHS
ncbi:disulfide reductase DsbH [Chlamydia pecorum]|uniref:disulfide reductase DsbH n=1 Tax=Chlamydia pecorum TaxID=85991 RepID=UPI00388D9BEF